MTNVEATAEDTAEDTGVEATIVAGVLVVKAVLGNLTVPAAPAVPDAARVVVPGALESALVVGWLVSWLVGTVAGGGLVVGDVAAVSRA